MVGGLGALGALGSIGGGLSQGAEAEARRRLLALQAQQLQQQQSGTGDAGAALMTQSGVTPPAQSMVPGASPIQGLLSRLLGGAQGGPTPAAAAPPSTPLARQPGGVGPTPSVSAPAQGGGAATTPPPPQAPQGIPPQLQAAAQQMDFPTLTNTLAKMPGMTPQRLMAALGALAPFMNMQSQQAYKMAMLQVQQGNLGVRRQTADQQGRNIDSEIDSRKAAAGDRGRNIDSEIDARKGAADARKQREARQQRDQQDREAKTASDAGIKSLSEWQAANRDAENERQRAISDLNNAYTATNDPDQEGTIKMLKENLKSANDRIDALHAKRPNVADDIGDAAHSTGAARKDAPSGGQPVKVTTPEDAAKLAPGTKYVTPDGDVYTR